MPIEEAKNPEDEAEYSETAVEGGSVGSQIEPVALHGILGELRAVRSQLNRVEQSMAELFRLQATRESEMASAARGPDSPRSSLGDAPPSRASDVRAEPRAGQVIRENLPAIFLGLLAALLAVALTVYLFSGT